jgi:hypothetical protein
VGMKLQHIGRGCGIKTQHVIGGIVVSSRGIQLHFSPNTHQEIHLHQCLHGIYYDNIVHSIIVHLNNIRNHSFDSLREVLWVGDLQKKEDMGSGGTGRGRVHVFHSLRGVQYSFLE